MSKSLKKIVEESREKNLPEVDMCDRGISNMLDVPGLFTLSNITQLVLSHNKLTTVPPNVADMKNLEVLNVFNNQIEELPTQISSLQKLKHLNLGMNRMSSLPRGFGSLPALEVLDLTYNNLNESSLPGNFFYLTTLRALYLSDNDFEVLPPDIGKLTKLQIVSHLSKFPPKSILTSVCFFFFFFVYLIVCLLYGSGGPDLFENGFKVFSFAQIRTKCYTPTRPCLSLSPCPPVSLSPSLSLSLPLSLPLPLSSGNLDLTGPKQVFKAENNPWVTPIADQFQLGVSHVFEYVRSETYKYLYGRHMQANPDPPKKSNDKSKKISRKPLASKNK
ncbi:leucine-rich repeat protein SHOC-2 [Anguilla rostrata]|uniref:leucine-rich repeat protein SHOC-2 n=1 Tax=Anguilla rostrata TaxID=7938 RepID=UPI0030D14DED